MQIPTLEQLGASMSSYAFAEWHAVLSREGLLPSSARVRHADLMAALFTGPATRGDREPWGRQHFMPDSVWFVDRPDGLDAPASEAAEPDIESFVAAHNARLKH